MISGSLFNSFSSETKEIPKAGEAVKNADKTNFSHKFLN